jgi:hypothetical protein
MNDTIYADPYSGHEILVIEDDGTLFGASYDPRRAGTAVAWHGDCRHCQSGRQRKVSIHVKREIQALRTRRHAGHVPSTRSNITEYVVPSNSHVHRLRYWRDGSTQHANVVRAENTQLLLSAVQYEGEPITISDGDPRFFQSKILRRCLRLIFSGREATRDEILACAEPLASAQAARARRSGYRNLCDKIDWVEICSQLRKKRSA